MQLKYEELKMLMEVLDDSFRLEGRELKQIHEFYNSNKDAFNPEQTREYLAYLDAKRERVRIIKKIITMFTDNFKIEIKADGSK